MFQKFREVSRSNKKFQKFEKFFQGVNLENSPGIEMKSSVKQRNKQLHKTQLGAHM